MISWKCVFAADFASVLLNNTGTDSRKNFSELKKILLLLPKFYKSNEVKVLKNEKKVTSLQVKVLIFKSTFVTAKSNEKLLKYFT